jgi:hypothetical protein
MVVATKGKASDIKPSEMFHAYLDQVKTGHQSPLFQLSRIEGELSNTLDKKVKIYEYMYNSSIGDELDPKEVSTYEIEAVDAEIKRWNDFNAVSTVEKVVLYLRQPLMMANLGTKPLPVSKFTRLRDMMNGNPLENYQIEPSESNYSFLMFNVTDKGYESEGGESEVVMGPEKCHDHSIIEVTSSANESSSITNGSSTIANESNPDGNESSSITDEVASDQHPEGWIARPVPEETYGTRRNLVGQRPLRESHKSQSRSLPRILPKTWDLFIEDPTPYVGHPQFIQISPRGFYDAVKEWPTLATSRQKMD